MSMMTAACGGFRLRLRLRGWGEVGVGISDDDSLAQVAGVGGAKGCGLCTGSIIDTRDVKASDATVEPEPSDVG